MSDVRVESDMKITEDAARWFGRLLEGLEDRGEFFRWLEESPRHVEELLFILADAQDLALLTSEQRARIDELGRQIGGETAGVSNVVPVSQRALASLESAPARRLPKSGRSVTRRWSVGLAAAVVAALGSMWWFTGPGAWKSYATGVGEQRVVALGDGSVVELNTDSAVAVRLTDSSRTVRLVRGEALFSVEHDPNRPFLVQSANAVIQAIGTRFDVYRRASGTRVAVIEGLVQVSDGEKAAPAPEASPAPAPRNTQVHLLSAGESAEVTTAGEVSRQESVDAQKAVAWRHRRLVFEEDTLGDIAAEFNRYNADVKIRVVGDAAVNEHFSGTFDADAPEAIMLALVDDSTLRVERVGNEILIQSREAP